MNYQKEVGYGLIAGLLVFLLLIKINVLPFVLFAGFIYLVGDRFGLGGIGNKAGTVLSDATKAQLTTFDDIGGQETAKQELLEALEFINEDGISRALGIRPLQGILLSGPPGTGKTLLAKAAASYTDSAFLAASGSEFVEMYAGVGAQRVRQLFERARETARKQGKTKAIIFIDEIDVLGGHRGQHSSHLEYDQTLNQLLVEMDGIANDNDVRILVIGATNRPDLLDSALLRPGRFDRLVRVDLPDKDARLQILKVHTRNKPLAADVDLKQIAQETYGFSGAHLESLANEAAILAMRERAKELTQRHFRQSIEKVMLGETLDRRPSAKERERISIHEAGHALVAEHVRPGSVANVTILSRGNALGYVRQTPNDDAGYLQTEEQIREQLWVLLAGAVAEELNLGSRSTGATGDFQKAIELARRYVLSGMSPLGVVDKEVLSKETFHEAEQALLKEIEEAVRAYLAEHSPLLRKVASRLQQEERIEGSCLRAWLAES
ncbi:MAG: AAA family ATPase [Firmicutes bacterium]|nr:AAA family ATPase [Bacillota bacterium]